MNCFDNLFNSCKIFTDPISKDIKNSIVEQIKSSQQIHDDVYVIIRLYQIKTNSLDDSKLKQLKNGNIKINIEDLPTHLQHILHEYVKMNKQ